MTDVLSAQAARRATLASIRSRRTSVAAKEAEEQRKIDANIGRTLSNIITEIAANNQAEVVELASALKKRQDDFMTNFLRYSITETAAIPGIGPNFKMRLARAGVHTAADVDGRIYGIPGIGPTRRTFLLDWVNWLKARAQQGMPTALPATVRAAITSRYATRRSNLEVQRSPAQQQYQNEAQTRYQAPKAILDCEEEQLSARSKAEVEQIRSRYTQRYHSITQARMKLAEDLKRRVSETDGVSEEIRRDLFRLHWEWEKLGRELMRFQNLGFGNYMRRVFWRA